MKTSESVTNITQALIKAQPDIKHAVKDGNNPHLKNDYATLSSVIDAVKDALTKNDIVVLQFANAKSLTTRLQHKSGEFFENEIELLYAKQDMQGMGSAITYARRYSLAAMCNIAQADDDGNATRTKEPKVVAGGPKKPAQTKNKNTDHF